MRWWDNRWRLVIAAILLPLFVVPIISVFLFPETPLLEHVLYGVVFSLFVAVAFRIVQQLELLGPKVVVVVAVAAALLALLLGFVFRIL